ncbi:hypothetical protein M2427_006917 [Bradyrhizobium sp. BR13661]|jgi:hypothetical protein|nr:hypothetical protein [Bradyrhizobium sp. BR13661]
MAGPAESGMIGIAESSAEAVPAAKATADVGGHDSRPDIFRLIVDRRPAERVWDSLVAVGMTMARLRAGQ